MPTLAAIVSFFLARKISRNTRYWAVLAALGNTGLRMLQMRRGALGYPRHVAAIASIALIAFLHSTFDADARSRRARNHGRATNANIQSESGWREGFASLVVDAKTGKVLEETNADKPRHPASLTKIMTLYMLFEQIDAGRINLDSKITISKKAAEQAPSKLDLQAGEKIEVEEAIKAIVTRSANDVACAIGEAISGSEEVFAANMTRKARALGMNNTTFRNASGLPDKEQITTARDLATLGRAIQDRFPRLYRFFSLKTFIWRGTQIANHNRLINHEGVDGIKTGYTRASGFNLVTSIKKNNRSIVAVVLGGRSASARDEHMRDLLNQYLPKAYAGERNAPAIVEAPATPIRVAATPMPRPIPGSREPIKPNPVRTVALKKEGQAQIITIEPNSGVLGTLTMGPFGDVSAGPPQPLQITAYAANSMAPSSSTSHLGALPNQPTKTAPIDAPVVEAKPAVASSSFAQQTLVVASVGPIAPLPLQPPSTPKPAVAQPSDTTPAVQATPALMTAARAGWHIQIGAYTGEQEAQNKLQAARAKLGGMLSNVQSYTEKTLKGSAEYFRARFAGFHDEAEARKACDALKRNDFSCIPVKN